MWFTHYIIGACLQLIGWDTAINTLAGLPICDPTGQSCTTSMLPPVTEYDSVNDLCYLPAPVSDPSMDPLWCQDVLVGDAIVKTPCQSDFVAHADTPYAMRLHWALYACPPEYEALGWCTFVNPCTPADELLELCTVDP